MEGSVGRVQAQKERSTVFVGIISFVDNTEPKSIVFLFFSFVQILGKLSRKRAFAFFVEMYHRLDHYNFRTIDFVQVSQFHSFPLFVYYYFWLQCLHYLSNDEYVH